MQGCLDSSKCLELFRQESVVNKPDYQEDEKPMIKRRIIHDEKIIIFSSIVFNQTEADLYVH
ncbi:hypothetical protein T06_6965 [Trichinella sp. T6]|nr:hypothetical protein T06_6965 [Trichinella sp. T6]